MKHYDAAVIGGGVLGCFAARSLRRWKISAVLIEAEADVCAGVTRANSAIVYSGCDNKPQTLKAQMSVRANAAFDALCDELEVPFSRCGSLMTAEGAAGELVLEKKLEQGRASGVAGLRLLSGQEAREMEPMLSRGVISALYAPTTGTVSPWQLGIAAYENALENGCEALLNSPVRAIRRIGSGYIIETDGEEIACRVILNCAGLQADQVQEMIFAPSVRIFADAADFIVLDKRAEAPGRILFQEAEEQGKGVTAVPTTGGNLLIASSKREAGDAPFATTAAGLEKLMASVRQFLPGLDLNRIIRSFSAVRPNPHRLVLRDGRYVPDGGSIGSFVIDNPGAGFWSLIGVKTPGLSCAQELGMHLARQAAAFLDARENAAFDPRRRAIPCLRDMKLPEREKLARENPDYAEIICRCEGVTRGEIIEAIRRGARDADAVKRRVGAGMGRCQGGRCRIEVEKILEEQRTNDR